MRIVFYSVMVKMYLNIYRRLQNYVQIGALFGFMSSLFFKCSKNLNLFTVTLYVRQKLMVHSEFWNIAMVAFKTV